MKLGVALLALTTVVLGHAVTAEAALTPSERAQVRDFVAGSRAENAARVRSLVARTDLTTEETLAVLAESVAPLPFTEARGGFLRELVFGGASAASRSLLALAVVRASLARADAVYRRYVGALDREPSAIAELVAIYMFLEDTIANAGRPAADAHDGISTAAYEASSRELRDHVERNARWVKGDAAIPESVGRVRAQAQSLVLDMLPDGLTRRVDAADRLGLGGARRQMMTEWGVLLADAGKLDDAKASLARQSLVHLLGMPFDLELLYAGDDRGPLRARLAVTYVGTTAEADPFGVELTPITVDPTVSSFAQALAPVAVKRALERRDDLRLQAERDVAAVKPPSPTLGRPRAPSVEHVIGAAMHLLVLDAPRAVDLAFSRALNGHPESAALLSDAIGALAVLAAPVSPSSAPGVAKGASGAKDRSPASVSLELGKAGGAAVTTMSAIRRAPNGAAIRFVLDGHAWEIERSGPGFVVTNVTRDGQPLSLAQLPTAVSPSPDRAKRK